MNEIETEDGMFEIYDCPDCNTQITASLEMKIEDQEELAAMWRSGRKIEAIADARKFNFLGNLANCKGIMVHISDPKDSCLRCGSKLSETGITYCPSCNGLNLNW
jgi:Zn finger protein HypA/HybF involved in hydrogenase expression